MSGFVIGVLSHRCNARRARELGLKAENSFEVIVRIHTEDELGGHFVA